MPETKSKEGSEFREQDLGALIANEIRSARDYYTTELSGDRARAIEYLRGEMNDTTPRPHGSEYTSRDLADTVSWMLPGIMRVFMSGEAMAEFEASAPDTMDDQAIEKSEEYAEQATDYVNYVFRKDNPGYQTVYDATYDSLTQKYGIVKHWWDDTPITEISHHTRLTIEQVAALVEDEDVEVLTAENNDETDEMQDPNTGEVVQVPTFNLKVERTTQRGKVRVEAFPPEDFIIDEAAITIDEARFLAHRDPYMTKSGLVEMGFDRDEVDKLAADPNTLLDTEEGFARQNDATLLSQAFVRSMERVEFYECYLKIDIDDDGIAEWIRVYYAGDAGAGVVMEWEEWEDDVPFSDIPCYPVPHRFDGDDVSGRTMDIQQIKTILLRQALDNLYASNLPMQEVEEGSVLNPDILVSPKFGGKIWKKKGSAPIIPHEIPFVADKVFAATEYFDRVQEKRTGVSQTMMALDPEALQNQSATANQNAKDAAYTQNELVARNQAEYGGWRRVFRQILKLTVKHQDRPRIIRLRGKFIEADPRPWNANMDCTVNVGLGTGSKDRDMSTLNVVLQHQLQDLAMLQQGGYQEQAFELIPKIRKTQVRIAEAAGLQNADSYYPEMDDETIKKMKQVAAQKAQQPPPEVALEQMKIEGQGKLKEMEIQAQGQLEQAKMGIAQQTEELKAQGNQVKEQAQLNADLQVKQAERENAILIEGEKLGVDKYKADLAAQLKREEIASRERVAFAQMENSKPNGKADART